MPVAFKELHTLAPQVMLHCYSCISTIKCRSWNQVDSYLFNSLERSQLIMCLRASFVEVLFIKGVSNHCGG